MSLKQDHHFLFRIPDNWIIKSQAIKEEENKKRDDHVFKSDNQWVGKIGEWAFYSTFDRMNPVTSHYEPTKKDFVSDLTEIRYEIKTKFSNHWFGDNFHADLNLYQYNKGKGHTDIYVFCYFHPNDEFLRLCGWLSYGEVAGNELLRKGDLWLGKYEVRSDKYSLPYKNLNSMHLLAEDYGEQIKRA